jgi:hypothetical protein
LKRVESEAEILLDQAHEISIYLADSVAPKCDDVKHLISQIEESSEKRRNKLELGLAANQDLQDALQWWESASKAWGSIFLVLKVQIESCYPFRFQTAAKSSFWCSPKSQVSRFLGGSTAVLVTSVKNGLLLSETF